MIDEGGGASQTTDPAAGSSAATDVSQLEHVSMMIHYERRGVYLLVGAVVAFGAFAWSEIQRRLVNLNHEGERIKEAAAKSVSSDTYEANEKQRGSEAAELTAWRKEVDRDRTQTISREEFQRDTKVEKRAGIDTSTKLIGVAIAIAALAMTFLSYQAATQEPPTITVNVPERTR